jgi:hypothetical protein
MKQIKYLTLIGLLFGLVLTAASASAKSRHRHSGTGAGGATGASLRRMGGSWPEGSIRAGQCDIKIDCAHYKVSVNGAEAGQIICGRQTGKSFAGRTVKLQTRIQGSSGKYLPRGFPMIPTTPELCSGCFIHVYPHLGPTAHSLGCVGISKGAWDKLRQCGGSEIAFTSMDGKTASKTPETQFASHIEKHDSVKPSPVLAHSDDSDPGYGDPISAPVDMNLRAAILLLVLAPTGLENSDRSRAVVLAQSPPCRAR